jgi:hypothetical protein
VRRATSGGVLILLAVAFGTTCAKTPTGPGANCGSGASFTVLPVPFTAISAATVVGGMSPPAHSIPSDHAGFYLNGTGIPLSSPGAFRITQVKTTHYLASTFRAGQSDFGLEGNLCGGYQLGLAHIQSLVSKIQSHTGGNCTTYSTANETVQSCYNETDIELSAGEPIGTVGGASAAAFDFGVYQTGHQNAFVNPSRYSSLTLTAVCPYDPFTPDLRNQINSVLGQPGLFASGESPMCGSMNVDVAGTAAGVWVLQSGPVNQVGDETNFVTLAPHPLFPQSAQTFSIGPAALSSFVSGGITRFPVAASGRVNRRFSEVPADGQIYCYCDDPAVSLFTYFVRLSGSVLTIQKVGHASGATPCHADPASWALDGTALGFIR